MASATRSTSRPSAAVTMSPEPSITASRKPTCSSGERLGFGDGVADHVAFRHSTEARDGVPLGRHAAVGEVGQIGGDRVGDEPALRSRHGDPPLLRRRQPVDLVVRHDPAVQRTDGHDEVLVRSPGPVGHLCRDRSEPPPRHPHREVDVVRPEVLDDADVADPIGERPLPGCRDLVQLAELEVEQTALQGTNGRVEPFDVADRAHDAGPLDGGEELGPRSDVRGEWLLDQHVHAGGSQRGPDREVIIGRCGDDRGVQAGGEQRLQGRVVGHSLRDAVRIAQRVVDTDELDPVGLASEPDVMAPHHPEADNTDPQPAHDDTASITRSRSPGRRCGPTGRDATSPVARAVLGRSRWRSYEAAGAPASGSRRALPRQPLRIGRASASRSLGPDRVLVIDVHAARPLDRAA